MTRSLPYLDSWIHSESLSPSLSLSPLTLYTVTGIQGHLFVLFTLSLSLSPSTHCTITGTQGHPFSLARTAGYTASLSLSLSRHALYPVTGIQRHTAVQTLNRLFPNFFSQLVSTKQRRKPSHGPANARRNAKRLEAWKARKGFAEEKRDPTGEVTTEPLGPEPTGKSCPYDADEAAGYDPHHPGYDEIATTAPVDNLPRPYHPTPKLATTRPASDITVPTETPTIAAASPLPVPAATPPTSDTAPLSSAELSALFDQLEGQYAAPTPRTPEPAYGRRERTLDEVLGSPIWELELTCSPIHVSPGLGPRQARVTPHARPTLRRLFAPTGKENFESPGLNTTARKQTRKTPVPKIALIPPPQDDPSTRRRPTRPCRPPARPRGPNTRYIGSPARPRSAPRPTAHPYRRPPL